MGSTLGARHGIAVHSCVEQKLRGLELGFRRGQQGLAFGGHKRTASRAMFRASG